MSVLKYPIGIQSFPEIIEKGYVYIDKTHYIPHLTKHGKYVFLSRPRRFGKSLLLSTLQSYFEGKRHLFKGLALNREEAEWESSPVFRFDFNNGIYENPEGLLSKLHEALAEYELKYGLPVGSKDRAEISLRFMCLIRGVFEQTGKQVVILVDEYDKPLLELEDHPGLFEQNQRLLKSLYSNLKSMDDYIRFAFITGVARFSRVSIFSDFNNLDDISLADDFADICGWTEQELTANLQEGIEDLSKKRGEQYETTLTELRTYYDGYRFTPAGSRLYNPFSVLRALKEKRIAPYWFLSGTPTFLVKRVKRQGIYPPSINGEKCTELDLMSVGLNDSNPVPLMFQTGYLTIHSYNEEMGIYILGFPNREVEIGFYQNLLELYAPSTKIVNSPFSFIEFKLDLYEGRPEDFMKRLNALFKDLPGEDHNESTYRALTYLLAVLSGSSAIPERHTYKGRSDLEIETGKYIYLFEFKYNRSLKEAMEQIKSRDYAGHLAMDPRTVYIIPVNFESNTATRNLQYEIHLMNK